MNLDHCVAGVVAAMDEGTRRQFASDPLQTLSALGLTVEAVENLDETRDGRGTCDGASFLHDRVILYRLSRRSRRHNFTLGHELGHYLVDQDEAIMDWLADQPDPLPILETICDRVAHALLLPDHVVTAVIGEPVRAGSVMEVYEHSQASRPACAIAVAQHLRGLGAVVITDPATHDVRFASIRPDPEHGWPEVFPWKGQPVPPGHPLKTLKPSGRLTQRSYWETPWGRRETFYLDAISDGRHTIAIFSERDLWGCEQLHIDQPRAYLDRPVREVTCCGRTTEVQGYPCADCNGGYCPACQQCRCEKAASREQPCSSCYCMFLPHLLTDGRCENCA